EIVLKGRNRSLFYGQLRRNLVRLLRDLGPLELRQRGGALAVFSPAPVDELLERARDVLGVNLLHPALVIEKSPEAACAAAVDLLRGQPGATFAVRARRRDKGFPLDSRELAVVVGRAVQDALGLGVNLTAPDLEIFLEVDKRESFDYMQKLQVLSQRRLMLKVASELGRREGAEVLVTGDSLGQVSSQTLHNLSVVEQAADLPLLRPLVAWDKAEIVREAEDIGTFAVSALPA